MDARNQTAAGDPDAGTRPRPVLMIPARRCGSHALRLRLNLSQQFYAPYPLHIVDFLPIVPGYGDLEDDDAYLRMVVDVVGLHAASMVKWPDVVFDPVEVFESIRDGPRSVHRIVWELYLQAAEQHGAAVVMDKSLDSVHYADDMLRLFPQLLFLNVVRDPRAQVASMNRAIIYDFDTLLNAERWVAGHRAAQSLVDRFPEQVLTIRYEDFLADQEAVLRVVCAFFRIRYDQQMLDIGRSAEAGRISQLSELWSSNHLPPVVANSDKFRKELSMAQIELIETLTKDYMGRYGYELMTDADTAISGTARVVAQDRSDAGRHRAWRDLEHVDFRDFLLRQYRTDYLASVRGRLERAGLGTAAPGGPR